MRDCTCIPDCFPIASLGSGCALPPLNAHTLRKPSGWHFRYAIAHSSPIASALLRLGQAAHCRHQDTLVERSQRGLLQARWGANSLAAAMPHSQQPASPPALATARCRRPFEAPPEGRAGVRSLLQAATPMRKSSFTSARSVAASYKPPMLVTRVRLLACAFELLPCGMASTRLFPDIIPGRSSQRGWQWRAETLGQDQTGHLQCERPTSSPWAHSTISRHRTSEICVQSGRLGSRVLKAFAKGNKNRRPRPWMDL